VVWPDGSIHWLFARAKVFHGADGQPLRILGVNVDITERKQTEQVMYQNARLLDLSHDAILIWSFDGGIVYWNRGAELLYGYTAQEVKGRVTHELLATVHPQGVADFLSTLNRDGEWTGELLHTTRDDRVLAIETRQQIIRNPDGSVLVLELNRDITERKQAEETQARLAAIVESSGDAIISKSLDGIVVSWNKAAESLFGYSSAEMIGQTIRRIIPSDLQVEEDGILAQLKAGQGIEHYETVRITKNGRSLPVSLTISPIRDNAGRIIGASKVLRDITERKLAEQSIQKMNEQLEKRVAERTAEVARAYELLQAEVLERKELEAEIARAVEREQLRMGHKLHEGLGQELTGIGYLMAALQAKLDKGSRTRAREAKKLQTMLMQSIEQTRNLAREFYPIELEQHGLLVALEGIVKTPGQTSDALYVVESDGNPAYAEFKGPSAIQLFRIAQEAVHNALTHAKAKTIIVRLATVNGHLILTVHDDGAGLSPNADRSPGMGFRIMRYRAGMVGGKLDVSSKPNAGVLVTFSVPDRLWLAPALREPGERTEHQTSPTSSNSPLV
jgi:PAS domain S-box-containing protein